MSHNTAPGNTPRTGHTITAEARAEAFRRFPDGIDVETGEPVDDYGYPATAREAFIEGAEWAAGRAETTEARTDERRRIVAAIREQYDSPPSVLTKREAAAWRIGMARAHKIARDEA